MPDTWCQHRKKFPRNPFTDTLHTRYRHGPRTCRPPRPGQRCMKASPTLWQNIVMEDREIELYIKREEKKNLPKFDCPSNYVKHNLYPKLIPAFEQMCQVTLKKDAHMIPVRFFDFLDGLAEILYNRNPLYPERLNNWTCIHKVFKNESRPCYPYHWFLTADEAATLIQAMIRGFLTRCKYNLDEMREEHQKILEGIEKQQKCYNALKSEIELIYNE